MSLRDICHGSISLLLCIVLAPVVSADSLWSINIDLSPAPSPEDGPPLSAHATRDRALLPYQILAIVGSYFGAVLILGTITLTVGRSLRVRAQNFTVRPIEMVKPSSQTFDPSPVSPRSTRNWLPMNKLKSQKSAVGSLRSQTGSVSSFDTSVLEADRVRRQEEMERLYAAVMQHDELRSQQSLSRVDEAPTAPPPEYSHPRVPSINTQHQQYRSDAITPITPETPRSPLHDTHVASPATDGSVFSYGSSNPTREPSGSKKLRKSLRHLKISPPMVFDDNSDGARTPLSPREYMNPGIPPEPPSAQTIDSSVYDRQWGKDANPKVPQVRVEEVRAIPRQHPTRLSIETGQVTAMAPARAPAASVNNPLPFRQLAAQQRIQRQQHHDRIAPFQPPQSATSATFPLSPSAAWNIPASAGPVKTTFLEARRDHLSGGLRTGAATPYSPYMPFTPITPVTPYLPSRRERKQREKQARAVQGVLTEEDEVKDDKELWGSGY